MCALRCQLCCIYLLLHSTLIVKIYLDLTSTSLVCWDVCCYWFVTLTFSGWNQLHVCSQSSVATYRPILGWNRLWVKWMRIPTTDVEPGISHFIFWHVFSICAADSSWYANPTQKRYLISIKIHNSVYRLYRLVIFMSKLLAGHSGFVHPSRVLLNSHFVSFEGQNGY